MHLSTLKTQIPSSVRGCEPAKRPRNRLYQYRESERGEEGKRKHTDLFSSERHNHRQKRAILADFGLILLRMALF
jgi:hypothetical protein